MSDRLRVERVTRVFGRGRGRVTAVREVSFGLGEGEVVGLLGVNGAGKTTLLKIISTLLLPTAGQVRVCGVDVVRQPRRARRELSVVLGGDRGFYNRVSARENLRFFAMLSGLDRGSARRRTEVALEQVGLTQVADRAVETFSKGMRQRLHLAVGMTTRPSLLLLDEPTLGLDALEAERLREHVASLSATGMTILLTSHYLADIERLAGRVLVLQAGRLTQDMSLSQLLSRAPAAAHVTVVLNAASLPNLPATADGDGVRLLQCMRSDDGATWTVTYQVAVWSERTLRALARAWPGGEILDVRVSPVGLEQVFAELSRVEASR